MNSIKCGDEGFVLITPQERDAYVRDMESNTWCNPEPVEPTCQVRNLDTGGLKTMTREAAKKLQAETKDACDWFVPASKGSIQSMFTFTDGGIYTYKLKAQPKQVSWTGSREDVIALLNELNVLKCGC